MISLWENCEKAVKLTDNMTEPEAVSVEDVFCENRDTAAQESRGLVFVGEKKAQRELGQIYRDAITALPGLLTTRTENYCFGASAFRAWADEIAGGRYDIPLLKSWIRYIPKWRGCGKRTLTAWRPSAADSISPWRLCRIFRGGTGSWQRFAGSPTARRRLYGF